MLRQFGGAFLAATLLVTSTAATAASTSDQAALTPGKATGVRQAWLHAPLWVWIAGIGFVALGVGLAASGNGNGGSSGSSTSTHL